MSTKSERLLVALSRVIRAKRDEAGMSQAELAERARLHRTYISNIERGTQNVSIDILGRIAEALDTTLTELITTAELTASRSISPVKILIVEDNPADVFLLRRCLDKRKNDLPTEVKIIENGLKASDYLKNLDGKNAELPELIFLDLNLPGKSGHELLQELKRSDNIRHVPVIILTTSSNPRDIEETYSNFANSYLTKSVDPFEFEDSINRVLDYWFATTTLPKASRGS